MTYIKPKKIFLLFLFIFTSSLLSISAECVSSTVFNYTIDFPEMFKITDYSQDERSLLFEHSLLPVHAVIRVWQKDTYKDSEDALKTTLGKISAQGQVTQVKWRNQKCAVTQLEISEASLGQKMSGWGVCIPLPESKDYLTVLSYAPQDKAYDCEQFILSLLDSIMIDRGSYTSEGIITAFAFPKKGGKKIELNIAGKTINTTIDLDDEEANQFVVDREFAVFKLFVNQKCWKEAWQRFYRLIAKDGISRVKKASFDISNELYEECKKNDPALPEAALAQKLLTWTQTFSYERPSSTADKADFTNIIATLQGKGSDCDSRSMLLMLLYKNLGLDSILLISLDYSHAMNGLYLEGKQGQTYTLDGKKYLFGETTAKDLTFGMIAQDMQDRTKWIPVELYE